MMLLHLLVAGAMLATGASPVTLHPSVRAAAPDVAPNVAPNAIHVVARPQPDSAAQLLRAGNDALARGDNKRAAEIFARLAERYPRTSYGNDARYFQALALYRTGDVDQLRKARTALDGLREVDSRTLRSDALALDTRICGELAKRGDERCARTVTSRAESGLDLGDMVNDIVRATTAATADAMRSPEIAAAIASAGDAARAGVDEGMRATQDALRNTADALRAKSSSMRGMAIGGGPARSSRSSECDRDEDNDVAVVALGAVQQMDAERAMPLLKKVMARRDKCSEVLRRTAVMLIARKNSADAADLLIDAARNDPDPEVKQQAVFWLSRVNTDRAAGFLREIAVKPGDSEVRQQALYALSQSNSPTARETLRQVAASTDTDVEVRAQAIHWLGSRGSTEDQEYLRSLYGKLDSRKLKDQLLGSMARRKGNGDWLLGIALDPKESIELRKQALYWAGQSGAPAEQLVALYDKTNDREMKEQLVYVFQQRGTGPAFDKLLDIARNEKDMEIRKNALYWVTRSKDPRALKLIEDIIEKRP
jgi:HEAT repeat protein